jgi:hypothetical protein
MTPTLFETPEALDDHLQMLNDHGQDPTVALVDNVGILWLTYGEEWSEGGDAMTCWLIEGIDPQDPNGRYPHRDECAKCGFAPPEPRPPLSAAAYPVRLLT